MTTTNDPEIYRERWAGHIKQLEMLKFSLDPDRWTALDEAMERLADLVDEAAEEFE